MRTAARSIVVIATNHQSSFYRFSPRSCLGGIYTRFLVHVLEAWRLTKFAVGRWIIRMENRGSGDRRVRAIIRRMLIRGGRQEAV